MGFPVPDTGTVTEDTGVVGGFLVSNGDINYAFGSDAGQWTAETITGAYGSQLVIDANGVWTYSASNSNASIQALNTGSSLTEVFTVTSNAGTSTVTITIHGQDEPPCFVKGTLIKTPHGERPIESLKIGDLVLTRDNGPQVLRWIGSKYVSANSFSDYDKLRPVRIRKDSFGPGIPARDLLVSPMHRVLLREPDAELLFGKREVLCAAKLLVNDRNIYRDTQSDVVYYHMLFDQHEVVTSNGCPSESFLPGPVGLTAFEEEARQEVFALFPELRSLPASYGPSARYSLRGYEAKVLNFKLNKPSDLLQQLTQSHRQRQMA